MRRPWQTGGFSSRRTLPGTRRTSGRGSSGRKVGSRNEADAGRGVVGGGVAAVGPAGLRRGGGGGAGVEEEQQLVEHAAGAGRDLPALGGRAGGDHGRGGAGDAPGQSRRPRLE